MESPALKRPRLSLACNTCRLRKVKCDADYPQCRNCRVRNQVCITSNPRRPDEPVVRQWIETPEKPAKGVAKGLTRDLNQGQSSSSPRSRFGQQAPSPEKTPDGEPEVTNNALEPGISPVHQSLDPAFNTDHATKRTKIVGGSSSQCLTKSLDVYFRAAHVKPVSGMFLHGMKHAEEMVIPLSISIPDLPPSPLRDRYVSTFLQRIQPLYPIFNVEALKDTIAQLASLDDIKTTPPEQTPSLASVYLVLSLGADEESCEITSDGDRYLHAAASLLGHIILTPYLLTVQALVLFTIAYRGRNKEGLGWQTLGMAIRIAYTLGIHRHTTVAVSRDKAISQHSNISTDLLEARIWAICYSLERTMQLESGRPSIIVDSSGGDALCRNLELENDLLIWHLGLAEYQGQICQHIYGPATKHRTARQLFEDTARLDRALLSWVNEIPPEMRPGNGLFCSQEIWHIAAFLSIMYHETMIALHRAALIAPNTNFEAEVEKQCPDGPSRFRIRGGESICVNSARSISRLSIELSDRGMETRLLPAGVPLLACIVLAIYLMKHPESSLQATDLQLLKACLELCSDIFTKSNQDASFVQGLGVIYERINAHLLMIRSDPQKHKASRKRSNTNLRRTFNDSDLQERNPQNLLLMDPGFSSSSDVDRNAQLDLSVPVMAVQEQLGTANMAPGPNSGSQYVPSNDEPTFDFDGLQGTPQTSLTHGSSYAPQTDDSQFPFEGYNVENLWNWMLSFDPGELGDPPGIFQ